MDVALESDVYLYLVEKRFELHMELTKRTLIEADGAIDIVYCGEDLGTQIGPLINPIQFKKLFASKYRALFDLAHSYGAKAMMHSCGSIQPFIPIFFGHRTKYFRRCPSRCSKNGYKRFASSILQKISILW